MQETMIQPDQETLNNESFDLKKFYRKHPELNIATVAGRSRRKMIRNNTVHLRAICPKCGKEGMKWYKSISLKSGSIYSNVWYCKNCNHISARKDLEYVKYV